MNQPDKQKLKQAQALLQQGRKAQAHAMLLDLSHNNPDESAVWLWLAYTADDLIYAGSYLQRVKRIDPNNAALPDAEEWLAHEERQRYQAENSSRKPAMPLQEALSQIESKPRPHETRLQHARRTGKIPEEPTQLATRTPPPNRRRGRSGLKISLFFLLIYLVLGGALAYLIASNSKPETDSLRRAGLPVYPGAIPLTLTSQDRNTLVKSYGASQPENSRDLEFEFYKLKKSEQYTALTYYDTEMRKLGWESPPQDAASSDPFTLKSYHKDKQSFFVFTSDIPGNASPLQSLRNQLTQNDLLLIVFHTEEI
jgi:hypothetical protein